MQERVHAVCTNLVLLVHKVPLLHMVHSVDSVHLASHVFAVCQELI